MRKERGYTLDLGPSILTLPHVFERLFERSGRRMKDFIPMRTLRPHWRNFFEDGKVVDLYPEPERMAEEARKAMVYEHIPYGVVLEENATLATLQRFHIVTLPNVGIVSGKEVALLRRYVEECGQLLVTGQSGLCEHPQPQESEPPSRC